MSVAGAQVEWKLDSWSKDSTRKWGYPAPKARGNQCSNNTRYCYPTNTASGSTRWGQMDDWASRKLLNGSTYKWDQQGFNDNATTGLQSHNASEHISWGDFIHKVLEKLSVLLVSSNATTANTLLWTREEWQSFEGKREGKMAPLDEVESGRRILFVIMCIITGLIEGRKRRDQIFKRRGRMCSTVDMALEFPRSKWQVWIEDEDSRKGNKQIACSRNNGYDGCQEASIALILSIYFSMKGVCNECGPYRLTYWIKSDLDNEREAGGKYCYFNGGREICNDDVSTNQEGGILITREGELDVLDRPKVVEAADVLRSKNEAEEKNNQAVVILAEGSTKCVDRQDKETACGSYDGHIGATLSGDLGENCDKKTEGEDLTLKEPSRTPILASSPEGNNSEEKLRSLVSNGGSLENFLGKDSDQEPGELTTSESGGWTNSQGPGQESEGEESTVGKSAVEESANEESTDEDAASGGSASNGDFVSGLMRNWPLMAGVVVVICLIVGSGYGLWRIFRGGPRPKRQGKDRRARKRYAVAYS
ncbi:hypothetical protein C922_05155 [Plasmodium inui San Antonio 1]|uniref:Uncharacterized protein n=1 Tax=Plasmodium inui San Antonio 1 TaxID=1237626 RepID=W6ZU67_9APIC|nr:hypothetical protein C922_05155 [Plasmodium inui San Antonio 1]EUD64467.1 hypothetical protein C922_05155 [Plasmodium inui San Antonio 1]